jgi:hypothetical protein
VTFSAAIVSGLAFLTSTTEAPADSGLATLGGQRLPKLARLLGVPGKQMNRPRPGDAVGLEPRPGLKFSQRRGELLVAVARPHAEIAEQRPQAGRIGRGRRLGPADQAADRGADQAEHASS